MMDGILAIGYAQQLFDSLASTGGSGSSVLQSDLTFTKDVGYITKGTVYGAGTPIEDILRDVAGVIVRAMEEKDKIIPDLDFENAKDNIVFQLINTEQNKVLTRVQEAYEKSIAKQSQERAIRGTFSRKLL